jgi:hypothetical protein
LDEVDAIIRGTAIPAEEAASDDILLDIPF